MIEIYKQNEVFLYLECSIEIKYELNEYFSCYAPSFKYHPRFKARLWNGKVSSFNIKESLLPIGLLRNLITFSEKYKYKLKYNFELDSFYDKSITKDNLNIFFKNLFRDVDFFPREYQAEAIQKILFRKKCVIESATGSGKSLIIYSIIRYLIQYDHEILLIVPNISLVEQMFSDFKEYGWKEIDEYVSILYSGKKNDDKKILISTWQSVFNKPKSFFSRFTTLMIDEVQTLGKSDSVKKISQKCLNSEYRIGTTGTLPEDKLDEFNIFGYLGPKVFETNVGTLIDKGVLSKIIIINLLCRYPEEMVKLNKKRTFVEEQRTITTYQGRNKALSFVFKTIDNGSNTLILCQLVEHLKALETFLINNLDEKYKVATIYGQVSPEKREGIRQIIEKEENFVLIGTYATMSTGINIKKIHNIVFASSYKSKIKILQSIGRGLRTHETKDKLYLFDIVDDLTWKKRTGSIGKNHTYLQFEERLKYYKNQGFKYLEKKLII